MKLITIKQAKEKGIFRKGDEVDLTRIIHPERERIFALPRGDTGIMSDKNIISKELKWFYDWNSTYGKPVLVGLPIKDCKISLQGKIGFLNGPIIMDKCVNSLYANNAIGIFGRQITEQDYYGLTKREFDEQTSFERNMSEVKDVEKVFTSTTYVKSYLGKMTCRKCLYNGFMKITFNPIKLSPPVGEECVYAVMTLNEKKELIWDQEENQITTPLWPILYGDIDELLVDISDLTSQNKVWDLYPPKQKSKKC